MQPRQDTLSDVSSRQLFHRLGRGGGWLQDSGWAAPQTVGYALESSRRLSHAGRALRAAERLVRGLLETLQPGRSRTCLRRMTNPNRFPNGFAVHPGFCNGQLLTSELRSEEHT